MNEKSNGNSYKALEDFEITISLKKNCINEFTYLFTNTTTSSGNS